jgi:membrane-bound ClpP family serine protease
MIEWVAVISLIIFGIALLITEIILIPGATIVGILGLLFLAGGLFLGFDYFGKTTGYYLLGTTVVISLGSIYFSLKSKLWEKFSLKSVNEGRMNVASELLLNVGDVGTAASSLRPFGKAEFGDTLCEVKSLGAYISAGTKVKIIKIESNKVFVEPVN